MLKGNNTLLLNNASVAKLIGDALRREFGRSDFIVERVSEDKVSNLFEVKIASMVQAVGGGGAGVKS